MQTIDDNLSADATPGTASTGGPTPARPAGRNLVALSVVVTLAGLTCWAVATWVSPWLAPAYLVVMAWLLAPGFARKPGSVASMIPESQPSADPDPANAANPGSADGPAASPSPRRSRSKPTDGRAEFPEGSSPDDSAGDSGGGEGTVAAPAKPKRTRSRRKASKGIAEAAPLVEATWVEVGPGKFVRVETPAPEASAQAQSPPHLPVDAEPEVVAEADPIESTPFEEIEPLAPADFAEACEVFRGRDLTNEDVLTADGIAPQVEADLTLVEPPTLDASPTEAPPPEAWADPSDEVDAEPDSPPDRDDNLPVAGMDESSLLPSSAPLRRGSVARWVRGPAPERSTVRRRADRSRLSPPLPARPKGSPRAGSLTRRRGRGRARSGARSKPPRSPPVL